MNKWPKKLRDQLRTKRGKIVVSVVVSLLALFAIFTANKKSASDILYRENKVEIGDIHIKVLATGTVQPENRLEIKPPIPGRIETVLIEEGQKVKKGQILAWMSSTERAALLDAARSKGSAEIKKWEDIYPPTPILSPISGTIVLKSVEQGESFTSSDSLMALSDRLTVKAQVDETDIAAIKLKQEVIIILDAYPDKKIPAQVDKIAFEATTLNNVTTYIVDVLPNVVPDFMRSGMTANVTFSVNSKNGVLVIPTDALKMKDGNSTVLVREGRKEIEREIEVGVTNGKQVEVVSGLNAGDVVLSAQVKFEKGKAGSSPFAPRGGKVKSK
jgi:macrolide-specific efflux system membrane fusion protein